MKEGWVVNNRKEYKYLCPFKFLFLFFISLILFKCDGRSIIDREVYLPGPEILVSDGSSNIQPCWHPAGHSIVFTSIPDLTGKDNFDANRASEFFGTESVIKEFSIKNHQIKTLVDISGDACFPAYSPDGEKLLYCSDENGNFDVFKLNLKDGSVISISRDNGNESCPRWSPDGQQIAYINEGRLVLADTLGENKQYASKINSKVISFCWSLDGREIIFSGNSDRGVEIYQYTLNTKRVKLLGGERIFGNSPAIGFPSPEKFATIGPQLAFEKKAGIYLYSFEQKTMDKAIDLGKMPSWSPDGKQLAFSNGGNIIAATVWVGIND